MTRPDATLPVEHERISALVELMKQEQQFLVAADADALARPDPTQDACWCRSWPNCRDSATARWPAAGFMASEAGMEPWLATQGDDPSVRQPGSSCWRSRSKQKN